ncbi:AbaSI family restriction endonuclease [Granulimonas faecalis]|uniref:AbaSI family restriction endonuclease n=1 Tax=Granulimonas faecalis TaxID=2894155 RepID=UPI0035175E20
MAQGKRNRDTRAVDDARRDYLVRVLSCTKRKDYENYVVNAVWQRLAEPTLQPETQRYVRRDNGYALVDLYFPAVNVGIECDEAYHLNKAQQLNDRLREKDIAARLNAVSEDAGYEAVHVRAFGSYEQMEHDIDRAVKLIRRRMRKLQPEPWMPGTPPWEICRERGVIRISDGLAFRTISDVYRCFGRDTKRMQRCYFSLHYQNYYLWCPKLGIEMPDGSFSSAAFGITNVISQDGKALYSEYEHELSGAGDDIARITFAQGLDELGRNAYRFIGVFEEIGLKENSSNIVENRRVAEEVNLTPWL